MRPAAIVARLPEAFGPAEREVLRFGALTARAFRDPSGVAALRMGNGAGEVVALPFRGQQVWDARFRGRRLTMGSPFDAPRATGDYLGSYGAFLIHCGIAAMGNPGPGDDHPLHGELPVAARPAMPGGRSSSAAGASRRRAPSSTATRRCRGSACARGPR